jgi:glycerophosphoryl diester phosphodiesterase
MKIIIRVFLIILFVFSCGVLVDPEVPECIYDYKPDELNELSDSTLCRMEGVYNVVQGSDVFGNQVVIKSCPGYMSVFAKKNGAYIILESGSRENDLLFNGYWRYSKNVKSGKIKLSISAEQGGTELLSDTSAVDTIIFDGIYGNNCEDPGRPVTLSLERAIKSRIRNKKFYIVAHRAGGRTADYLPASENTIEMIRLAERLGANAIEIDVKLSKDRIPFLYHDRTINSRLVQKSTVWGNIEDFTFPQLKTHITLINGEKIPSLQDALDFVLDSTDLKLVWLDMKSEKNDMEEVITIQKSINDRAFALGRDSLVYIGLPTEEKINHFFSYNGWEEVLSLCELDVEDVDRTKSEIWGPRWTLGLQTNKVDQMHDDGKKVIVWTLDESQFISQYMSDGKFNGMVTNYSPLVAYFYYVQ